MEHQVDTQRITQRIIKDPHHQTNRLITDSMINQVQQKTQKTLLSSGQQDSDPCPLTAVHPVHFLNESLFLNESDVTDIGACDT